MMEGKGGWRRRHVLAGIALVPEGRRLFTKMSVEENLELGCYLPAARAGRERSRQRVCGLFPVLRDKRSQLVGELSGGQQQMVAIGRALMARPRTVLSDEPSLGLAVASVGLQVGSFRQLREAVAFLKKAGVRFTEALPAELYPGVDYAVHIVDPAGHCLMLYYYMERLGWDGRPRPASERRKVGKEWPEHLEPQSDTYADPAFMGPLGLEAYDGSGERVS